MTLVDGLFRRNQARMMRRALQSRGCVRETEKQQVDGSTGEVGVKEVLIRATSKRATATCSEEVGFDDGSSGCLTALRKRWRPTQTLRRAALSLLAEVCLSASTRFLLLGTGEPTRSGCRFAFPCCNITNNNLYDDYRYTLSSQ